MNHSAYVLWQRIWYGIYAAGAVAILVLWWRATGSHTTSDSASILIAIGNVAGLIGTYLILWQMVLLSRLTILENVFGMEKQTWLHKWNGYLALTLIIAHAVFLTLGYGALNQLSFIPQFIDFLNNWQDLLTATIGLALLILIVFISIGIVRRGLKYETWFYTHLCVYIAILLGFFHQLSVGSDFVGNPEFQIFWYALYTVAIGSILLFRAGRPTYLLFKHRFRVDKLVPETPGVTSVYITGRQLDKFPYQPGQFIIWRFLDKNRGRQAHPFTISVAPNGKFLRLTPKSVGDFTRTIPDIKPGTFVLVDGPHGNFTTNRTSQPDLLLIAGGIGITPIRSIIEQLPARTKSAVLIYAARTESDFALRKEVEELASKSHVKVHFVTGRLDDSRIKSLVPDASTREVMLCGPPDMMDAVTAILINQGVPKRFIHTERFAY